MALNFNVDPYNDDFDPSKNFYRILFKPGYAVQARELTQSQTILQDQITKFATNIFAQNTPISGGQVTTNLNCFYIQIQPTYNNITIDVSQFQGKTITSNTGTILAKVIATVASTGTSGDPATLIVTYFSGSYFSDNQIIYDATSNLTAQVLSQSSTGSSSIASITQGVFYIAQTYTNSTNGLSVTNGNFVQVNPQTIVLDKYDNSPNTRIGLSITETIIDYTNDSSLLDPALGASNYQAPGADRYSITLNLTSLPLTPGNDDGFIELARVQNGNIVKIVNSTSYSLLDDYLAKRTFETNGDFIVKNFNLTAVTDPNSSLYDLNIGNGLAYVHGYRLENQGTLVLTNNRARDTSTQNTNTLFVEYGSYFYVDTVTGVFDVTTGMSVDLHLVPTNLINTANTNTYNSTLVGSGYIRNLTYDHNTTDSNTASYVFKAYVYDIGTNILSSNASSGTTNTITFYDPNNKFSSIANSYSGVTLTIDSGIGSGYSGTISSYNNTTKTATVSPNFSFNPNTTSNFSLRFETGDVESLANTVNSAYANINLEGKLLGLSSNPTLYLNPINPQLIYSLGEPYVASVSGTSYSSVKEFRGIPLSLVGGTPTASITITDGLGAITFEGGNGGGTLSTDAIKQNYTVILTNTTDTANNGSIGTILDFCSAGNTVTISADSKTATFSSTHYKTPSTTLTIIAKVNVNSADSSYILKNKTLISGNTSLVSNTGPSGIINSNTFIDLVNGQVYINNQSLVGVGQKQSLYISDVKNIVTIIDTGSPSTPPTLSMLTNSLYNVTSNFTFNNGQRDSIYNHAYISLNPGAPVPKGNILVVFNYYKHSGGDGYFSYQSYAGSGENYALIPSYTAKNGTVYNLRDCIDFRPTRKNATSAFIFDYTSSPSPTNDFGYYIPQDLTNFTGNYSYYLGRNDILVLSKDKNFQIVQGKSSIKPTFPVQPDASLLIAKIYHDPYTAFLPSEAPKGILPNLSMEKVYHRRWRMQDITELERRVDYVYDELKESEKTAMTTTVPDDNGIDRLNTGIVVDDFTSLVIADTSNPYFSASIDSLQNRLTASQTIENYPLQSATVINGLGNFSSSVAASLGFAVNKVSKTTNYFSLPYSNTAIVVQSLASNTVYPNPFTTAIFQGVCKIDPPVDTWVDKDFDPDNVIADPRNLVQTTDNVYNLNTLNVVNWQSIPGTQNPVVSVVSNLGSPYVLNNGYITNDGLQPYIKPQQLVLRGKGLKLNYPIRTWFDNDDISDHFVNLDIIELSNVSGLFDEDDVIGYKDYITNHFYPYGTVVGVYNYGGVGQKVRLYVLGQENFHGIKNFKYNLNTYVTNIISNAEFDGNGNYTANTAFGYQTNLTPHIVNVHASGTVTSVGNGFVDYVGYIGYLFRRTFLGYSVFLNNHGVWSDQDGNDSYWDRTFNVNFTTSGTYYHHIDAVGSYQIWIDGVLVYDTYTNVTLWSRYGNPVKYSYNHTSGYHTIRIKSYCYRYGYSDYRNYDNHMGFAIADRDWILGNNTKGNILFSLANHNINPLDVGNSLIRTDYTDVKLYSGVTQFALSPAANASNTNFYNGSTINITSSYRGTGQNIIINSSAKITSYNAATRIVNVDTPVTISLGYNTGYTSTYTINGTYTNYILAQKNNVLHTISTNEDGNIFGVFNIPQNTYRTGKKVFRFDDRVNSVQSTSTTWCEGVFNCGSLIDKHIDNDLSPSVDSDDRRIIPIDQQENIVVNPGTVLNINDPIAQTFTIDKKSYPNGVFISSVKIFFYNKATTTSSPVTLSIVQTVNGQPNGKVLDNSTVVLTPERVNYSHTPYYLDNTTWTEFVFPAPCYVQSGVNYAIVIQSPSSEYQLHIARQNDLALASCVNYSSTIPKIGSVPYTGNLFHSQNSGIWNGDQTQALMFIIERCVFNTTVQPKIPFHIINGSPTRKLATQDIQAYYDLSLVNNIQGTVTTNDNEMDELNFTTTDYVPTNTNISYSYQAQLMSTGNLDAEKSIIPGKYGAPNFVNENLNDGQGPRMLQANTSNSFTLFATLSSVDDRMSPFISDDGLTLYNIQWSINNLNLSNNNISVISGGSGYNVNTASVSVSSPDISGGTQATAGLTLSGNTVQSVYLINSGAGYLNTPIITVLDSTTRSGNANAVVTISSEFSPTGGNAIARYISKLITIGATNISGDLRTYYTAYRPIGTNIYVFYRVQNLNDPGNITSTNWQLMTTVNNGSSYSQSENNLVSLVGAPGINGVANNKLSYINSSGTTYTLFNQVELKIVLTTNDNTKVPYLTALSILALPAGN